MKLRLFILAALSVSGVASAADAPALSQAALAECRLRYKDAMTVMSDMTQIASRTDDKEGEESDIYDLKLDAKPLGMNAKKLEFTYTVTKEQFEFVSIRVYLDSDFETAKTKLSAMRETSCETKGQLAGVKQCGIKAEGNLRAIDLFDLDGEVSYICGL